jgi:hypothetical protein
VILLARDALAMVPTVRTAKTAVMVETVVHLSLWHETRICSRSLRSTFAEGSEASLVEEGIPDAQRREVVAPLEDALALAVATGAPVQFVFKSLIRVAADSNKPKTGFDLASSHFAYATAMMTVSLSRASTQS